MATKIGINGFGRMGRLALRAAWTAPDIEFAHINELKGDSTVAAHLLTFDSVHGRFAHEASASPDGIEIQGRRLGYTSFATPGEVPWREHGVEIVLECSGKFRTAAQLEPYFKAGVKKVIVAAPR